MGRKVRCPGCHDTFHVHGYEGVVDCFKCDNMLNPQRHYIQKESGECRVCGEIYENVPIDWKLNTDDDGNEYRKGIVYCPECGGWADELGTQEEYER